MRSWLSHICVCNGCVWWDMALDAVFLGDRCVCGECTMCVCNMCVCKTYVCSISCNLMCVGVGFDTVVCVAWLAHTCDFTDVLMSLVSVTCVCVVCVIFGGISFMWCAYYEVCHVWTVCKILCANTSWCQHKRMTSTWMNQRHEKVISNMRIQRVLAEWMSRI